MRRAAFLSFALATAIAASSVAAAAPAAGARTREPVRSLIVRVDAPGVVEQVRDAMPDAPWRAAPAPDGKLGRLVREAEGRARAAQAPVARGVRAAGARIVSSQVAATNALLVHATASQAASIAGLPGVRSLEPAPLVRPMLRRTVPYVGADAVRDTLGYGGEGTIIAVLDSGIDYTHGAFGGPGTLEAYEHAAANAERIDDEFEGRRLFPNEKVIGGWDFVGPNYTSPELCPPESAAAGLCTSEPNPDPDPLDQAGHGTHVASAAAGLSTEQVGHGVAPAARLLALKIYGPPRNPQDIDEAADVLIDAIDWCVRVNLGLSVPGTVPPEGETIDVLNMSLGESYGQGSRLYDEVIDAAVEAGIVVVAAAGNGQDRPFVTTSPGTSPQALSVASMAIGGEPGNDAMSGHSGRGPSRFGALKPDLSAPGAGILSAAVGTGTGIAPSSGTSLATPHVAGAAALLAQRSADEGLALGALDLAALLMNYAVPMPGDPAPAITRQGAGRLAVDRAAAASIVARAGDIASLNLGAVSLAEAATLESEIELANLGAEAVDVRLAARPVGGSSGEGVTVVVPGAPLRLDASGSRTVSVLFHVAPERLAGWPQGMEVVSAGAMDRSEVAGRIDITPVGADGQPLAEAPALGVPYYLLPRAASAVTIEAADDGDLRLRNAAATEGQAELFVLPEGGRDGDPDEPELEGDIDLAWLGARFEAEDGEEPRLRFGVVRHEPAAVPWMTVLALYLDLDRDGGADVRVRTGPESALVGGMPDRLAVGVTEWDAAADGPVGDEAIVGTRPANLHSRVFDFAVPLSALGREAPFAFDLYAVHRGLGEDWLFSPREDLMPDGVFGPCAAAWLRFEPDAWGRAPEDWSRLVAGGASVDVDRVGGDGFAAPLLALLPRNRFEPADGQHEVLLAGTAPEGRPRGGCNAYLPSVVRHYVVRRTEADAVFASALDAAAGRVWLKMEYSLTDYRDHDQDARRTYRFRNPDGMRYTLAPLNTDYYWDYIRVGNEAFVLRHREGVEELPWRCVPVDEWMLFWPGFIERFRSEFAPYGWRITGRGSPGDPDTWTLENADAGGVTYLARVNRPTGLPVLLSRKDPARRLEVYKLYDYGQENHGLSRPLNVACP